MTAVAMNNQLNYIAGLNLSQRNRAWQADKIVNLPNKEKVVKDPTLMTEEEFLARVDGARKRGKQVSCQCGRIGQVYS